MLFNSFDFVIFFAAVVALYFAVPHRFRWMLLLAASCYFYMAFIPKYILVLAFLILLDFFLGKRIEATADQKRRRHWLWLSIASNIGTLFVFKYFNFFFGAHLSLALPLGLSFHTFQSLSYVVDVYRGKVPAERHLGIYALYVMFFPQLVAGPIERPAHMLPQFRAVHSFSYPRLVSGMQRMAWGFFKKIAVADRLAVLVNTVYGGVQGWEGPSLALATALFAFQIYCDFSGYCDIAIGAAEAIGFELSENFDAPYLSRSVGEFWRRWHITLSSWFRDYVYIPLGGSRGGEAKTDRNLLLTFLLSGLWHGANWTFMAWGLVNGIYLVIGRWKGKFFPGPLSFPALSVISTFFLSCFAWIFFRAKSLADAWYVVAHLGSGWGAATWAHSFLLDRVDTDLFVAAFGIAILLVVESAREKGWKLAGAFSSSAVLRAAGYAALVMLVFALWEGRGTEFIYFQF